METMLTGEIKRGDRLTRTSGVYSVVVTDVLIDSAGDVWIGYIIVENCDETFKEAKEASERQELGEKGINFVKAKFYETNYEHWLAEARFRPKFTRENVERVPLVAVDPVPVKTEHISFGEMPAIPEPILMSPDARAAQAMIPVVRRTPIVR